MTRLLPRRALLLAPTGVAVLGGAGLLYLRQRLRPEMQWQVVGGESRLVGRTLPGFALPGLAAGPGFDRSDVAAAGQPVLINFFASWCVPCAQEVPELRRLAAGGLAIWGIDYRDKPGDALDFLRLRGSPYRRVGCDESGAAGRAFGLNGVPESFLVAPGGTVRWHWAGGLSADVVTQYLEPALHG
jgi:cytochrome c biogenesis protein CcmG/thiol:disulfide interchange protein DsbE